MYESALFTSWKGMPTSTFRGHAFSDDAATYPGHAVVLAYLSGVAKETLLPSINLSVPVERGGRTIDAAPQRVTLREMVERSSAPRVRFGMPSYQLLRPVIDLAE